ncbi:MAG TPA: hypothetical protein VFB32_01280 [Rudaea sp.]|nr:hypothetical protein [Rudaea sp.]
MEAILQLRAGGAESWDAPRLATRLYVRAGSAATLLADLCAMGIARPLDEPPLSYRYAPETAELAALLDALELAYSRHLVDVTRLIHSVEDRSAHDFAAAFRFRKEP